jgi:hypothetical protein
MAGAFMERIRSGNPPPQEQIPCPACPRMMLLVGQETSEHARGKSPAELLTFQCDCGQIITTMTEQ